MNLGDNDAVVSQKWRIISSDANGEQKGPIVYFDNGLLLSMEDLRVSYFAVFEKKHRQLKYVRCITDGTVTDKEHQEYDDEIQALCVKDQDGWRSIGVLPPQLSQSLLIRLSFIRRGDSRYFEPFMIDKKNGIYVYKINWE